MSAHDCDVVEVDVVGEASRWEVTCATCGLLVPDRRLAVGDALALALDHERYQGRYGS